MGKLWKKGAALVLAAVMCTASLSGCSKKAEAKSVYTFNGEKVDADLTMFLLRYDEAGIDQSYGQMFESYYGQSLWVTDLSGTGEVYETTYKTQFGESLERLLLAEEHAGEYDAELSDDEKAKISEAAAKFIADNDEKTLASMNATQEVVERALSLYTIQSKVQTGMTADVDTEVSDEEAAQRKVSFIRYTPTTEAETEAAEETEAAAETEADAVTPSETEPETAVAETGAVQTEEADKTGSSDETEDAQAQTEDPAQAAAEEKYLAMAQEELDRLLSGEADFESEAAAVVSEGQTGVVSSYFTFGKDDTYPDAAIIEATDDLADGELVDHIVEVSGTYYILHVDAAFDEEATADKKDEIVEQRKQDRIDEIYEGWISEESWETDAEALAAITMTDRIYSAPEVPETEADEAVQTEADALAQTEAEVTAQTEAE